MDHLTDVEHASPHGISRQLYKGVLDDHASAAYSGKVHVHRDAQKTNAEQANHNLLLSEDATADSKPQLEIYADDVKCTHGATVGPDGRRGDLLPALSRGRGARGAKDASSRLRGRGSLAHHHACASRSRRGRTRPTRAGGWLGGAGPSSPGHASGCPQTARGLPRARACRSRQSARVPGQRRHDAQAPRGSRGGGRLLPRAQLERPPGRARPLAGGHGTLRGRTGEDARLPGRLVHEGDPLHTRRDGVGEPRGERVGPREPEAGRRSPRLRDGAPLEHRSVADGLREDRCHASRDPDG